MSQLTTVFEITSGSNSFQSDAQFRIVIGVVILVAGIVGLILHKKTGGQFPKKLYGPAFMTGWGVLWLIIHITFLKIETTEIDHLLDVYRSGNSQIVEGVVHISHEQPATGHTAGDKITIGDRTFEVNYFLVTPGYRQTISYGGVLREGVFARLHYYDGIILKVEVGNKKAGQLQNLHLKKSLSAPLSEMVVLFAARRAHLEVRSRPSLPRLNFLPQGRPIHLQFSRHDGGFVLKARQECG